MKIARCTWCDRPGVPYEYHGQWFDGLCAYKGDRLCPSCRDARVYEEGVNIREVNPLNGDELITNTADERRKREAGWVNYPGSRFMDPGMFDEIRRRALGRKRS